MSESQDPCHGDTLIDPGGQEDARQPQEKSNFSDGSGPLFNMYVKMAKEEDDEKAERWQKDADGILIFTGLFSAAVAALIAISIQDLSSGPQYKSEFYLENIYLLLLANPNVSRASILATPAKPPPFSPPTHAIWVNSLWFLSLAISLTCALLATLLQQWARRYLTATQQPRYPPHKRARVRAFLADGVDKLRLPWVVETLPILLHLSLFFFFSGLLVYLFNVHLTVFMAVVWWVGLTAGIYGFITLMPIHWPDSPYYAPLSSPALIVYTSVSYGVFRMLRFITDFCGTRNRSNSSMSTYSKPLGWDVAKTAREVASVSKAEIFDRRVLRRTINALDEDHELEQFFECIPGFCSSEVVDDPKGILAEMDDPQSKMDGLGLTDVLIRFWNHTLTSSFVSENIKKKRLVTCVKAADSARLSRAASVILKNIFRRGVDGVLRTVEIGYSLGSRDNNNDNGSALCAQGIVTSIIASVPVEERDNRWNALVRDQLGVSEDVLREYLAHGDSVLFANLIHITRQFFRSNLDRDRVFDILYALSNILPEISGFDVQNTLPVLQNDFCALWNEIVLQARNPGADNILVYILSKIRHIYIVLHQGTGSAPTAFSASTRDDHYNLRHASSYPSCNVLGHESAHASAATSPTVPHPDTVLAIISPSAGPDVSPAHAHPTP